MEMTTNLLTGALVRLSVEEPKEQAKAFYASSRDSEFRRLLDSSAAGLFSLKQVEKWVEEDEEKERNNAFNFGIRALADDRLIGDIGLWVNDWCQGEAFVGIGLNNRPDWGKGYGSDAMQVILRYGFCELNLRRVVLNVFEYNPRGIRSYEKCGFVHEGRVRKYLRRDGQRWDMLYMGILREEWVQKNQR